MKLEVNDLVRAAKQCLDEVTASRTTALLLDAETRLVDGSPTREVVRHLLPTLKARVENVAHTGKQIYGLTSLVAKLAEFDSATTICGYGFISSMAAGNVYLVDGGDELIGAAIVDR